MLYVQQDRRGIAHLEVDSAVLQLDGCVFTDGNAASNETRVYDRLEELAQLDWRVIRTTKCYSKEYKRKKAAEVLAISPVPPRYLRRVHVADQSAKAQLGQLPVSVEVSPYLYTW